MIYPWASNSKSILNSNVCALLYFQQKSGPNTGDESPPPLDRLEFNVAHSLIPTINVRVKSSGANADMIFTIRIDVYPRINANDVRQLPYPYPSRMSLWHGDRELFGTVTLGSYFLEEDVALTVKYKPIPVFICNPVASSTSSSMTDYTISPHKTTRDLKAPIQMSHSMDISQSYLIFRNKLMLNDMTLEECGVHENAVIRMQWGPRIVAVKCFREDLTISKRFVLELDPCKTTDAEFRVIVQEKYGIPQTMRYIHLSNLFGNKFEYIQFQERSPMCLVELFNSKAFEKNEFPIFVSLIERGNIYKVLVEGTYNIGAVMILGEELDISFPGHRVTFNGDSLPKEDTLVDCNIGPTSLLNIEPDPNEVNAPRYPVMDKENESDSNIYDIKRRVFRKDDNIAVTPFVIELARSYS